jgi:hypothetical protein
MVRTLFSLNKYISSILIGIRSYSSMVRTSLLLSEYSGPIPLEIINIFIINKIVIDIGPVI